MTIQGEADESKSMSELKRKIDALEQENFRLRQLMVQKVDASKERVPQEAKSESCVQTLSNAEIERYSRQLLLSNGFGVNGQRKLLGSSVCVIGAGGIGSTVILYLAACGVGHLTIVDFDEVDISNLHRQVIHKSRNVGINKAQSAARAAHDLNPTIRCETIQIPLASDNALEIISRHDCVVDASDNPKTRYLINDACVLAGIPLVSGSAIGIEGQLTVYNYNGSPCYRCLYPKPDSNEGSKSCSDHGVLGPVPGLIGVLQAVETMKVVTGIGEVMAHHLLMYDALRCSFLRVKKPPRQSKCLVCGDYASIVSMADSDEASKSARGPSCSINETPVGVDGLEELQQITPEEYNNLRLQNHPHVLLDVRVPEQFALCSLPGSINIPLRELPDRVTEVEQLSDGEKSIYCICRRGKASISATVLLSKLLIRHPKIKATINVKGGLDAWRQKVDESFPRY